MYWLVAQITPRLCINLQDESSSENIYDKSSCFYTVHIKTDRTDRSIKRIPLMNIYPDDEDTCS